MRGESAIGARPPLLEILEQAPVLMAPPERLMLYSLVRGLRPARVLEIGTHKGGSAMIMVAALDEIGAGLLVCIDPAPVVTDEHWRLIAHRATLLTGSSPAVLEQARATAGGLFGFAFVDGDHTYGGVLRDIEGVLPVLADDAHLLFHDAHFREVRQAIDEALLRHPQRLIDCGMLSVEENPDPEHDAVWGGLRLLRHAGHGRGRRLAFHEEPRVGRTAEELAEVISETTGLVSEAAARAAQGLVDRGAYPVDYVAECRALWPKPAVEFVHGLYRLLLGRDPDPQGVQWHVGRLKVGDTRLAVVRMIAFSEEARSRALPTTWIEDLEEHSATFPVRREWISAGGRKLRSWVRRYPPLARAARYVLVTARLPWMAERLHGLALEQQQHVAQQQRELRDLASRLDRLASRPAAAGEQALHERLTAVFGSLSLQAQRLEKLSALVEALARELHTTTPSRPGAPDPADAAGPGSGSS